MNVLTQILFNPVNPLKKSFLLAAVAVLASGCLVIAAEPAAGGGAAAARLDAILTSFPAKSAGQAEELYRKLLEGGSETVMLLCSRVAPAPAAGTDASVRFALHGLTHYAARFGADAQRRLVATALTQSLDAATDGDIQDFLLEQLRFVADPSHAPAASRHLLNARTAHRAAALLTTIGGRPAESALIEALPKADPACATAILQALGDLGSDMCAKACAAGLDSTNCTVQSAALFALSRSGSSKAGDILAACRRRPPAGVEPDTILDACLDHADRLLEKGEGKRAAALARQILDDKAVSGAAPRCRALALLGMTKDAAVVPVLLAAMAETNTSVRSQAAAQIGGLQGKKVTPAVMAAARAANGQAQASLLEALSLRPDFTDATLLADAMRSQDVAVRSAALDGLARMRNAAAATALLAALEQADSQDRPAIVAAVKTLSGKEALAGVADKLASPSPIVRETAVQTLMDSRAREHSKAVLQLTRDPEAAVARAAFKALVVLASDAEIAEMINAGLASADAAYRASMSESLVASAPRVTDRTKFAGQLVSAYRNADAARRIWIIALLPVFGGAAALETAAAASASPEAGVREAAARALAAWPDDTALPALLTMVAKGESDSMHALALPGAVRLLRETAMPSERRLECYAIALKSTSQASEIWQVLSAISEFHVTGALELVAPLLDREDVRQEAALAMARIACPQAGEPPALPPNQAAALQKACDLVADKALKDKFAARLAALGK